MAEGELPVFWSFRRCPYAMRARLALKAAGQQVLLREILLRDKPAAFLAVATDGTVPVLVLPDAPPDRPVIAESRDIMLWALGRADPLGWLAGLSSAQIDQHFDQLDGPFKYHLDRYKYASRYAGAEAAEHRSAAAEIARGWDYKLAGQGALSGARAGLLDYASLPFMRQFRIADPDWFDAQDWPHLNSWLGNFLASAELAAIMQKYPLWQEGEAGILF